MQITANHNKMNETNILQIYRDNGGSGTLELKHALLTLILSGIDVLIFFGNLLVIVYLLTKNKKSRLRRGNPNEQQKTGPVLSFTCGHWQ